MELVKDMVLPANATGGRSGKRTSKYLTAEMIKLLISMEVGSGFVVPLMGGEVTAQRQRYATWWQIGDYFKKVVGAGIDGYVAPTFAAAIMPEGKGIAIKKLTAEVKPAEQPEEQPAEQEPEQD